MTQLQRVSPTNSISPWIQNRISRRLKNASTITRNNSIYVIHSPYPTCTTVVENNIYKAIDRLASMSRSPPKINAESNISHGYSRWMQIYPSWFFLPLLSPFNLEKPNEITQNVYIYIYAIYICHFSNILHFLLPTSKVNSVKETAQIATKSQILFPSRIRVSCSAR